MADFKMLAKVRDAVAKSKTFNQERWYNECGTPGCIAGHAVACAEGWTVRDRGADLPLYDRFVPVDPSGYILDWDDAGAEILDLDKETADSLFSEDPLSSERSVTRVEAVRAIENVIETGSPCWSEIQED